MLFASVSVESVAHVDAPVRVTVRRPRRAPRGRPSTASASAPGLLEEVAGIRERRYWQEPAQVADGATLRRPRRRSRRRASTRDRIGLLVSTSVSRDYIEPSTAAVVHGALGLPYTCLNFDLGNALPGLPQRHGRGRPDDRARRDRLRARSSTARSPTRSPSARSTGCCGADVTAEQVRAEFASLTLGSGAAAMVLGRAAPDGDGHRYRGSVHRAATQFSHLCRGNDGPDGHRHPRHPGERPRARAPRRTRDATAAFGWTGDAIDEYVLHQVSQVHTDALVALLGIDPAKVLTIYPEHGNVGPAALPIVLSKLRRRRPVAAGRPDRPARHRLRPQLRDGRGRLVAGQERDEPPQQRVGAQRVGAVPAYAVGDLAVGGDHHHRPPGRLGPDQPADQLVGGLALAGEQHPHAARRRRQPVHPLGAVEDAR